MISENILDVLMYLFNTYADDASTSLPLPEKSSLFKELRLLGFPAQEIEQALSWLKTLDNVTASSLLTSGLKEELTPGTTSGIVPASRIFHPEETMRLDKAGRGFLFTLEHADLITPAMRESILENAMILETPVITVEQLKYITLMTLCHYEIEAQSGQWLTSLIEQPALGTVH